MSRSVLLGLPPHRRRVWVLALDPVQRAPRAIGGVAALRDDAFEPELAGVLEDERPVVLVEVLVEAQARRRARKQAGQCRLAHGERITAQVVTVELDQVEGVEEDARVMVSIANAVEARYPVIAARHRLAWTFAKPR